jgi:hypothetical protein
MLIFVLYLAVAAFVAFPESNDAIFARENKEMINIETSGSLGLFYNGKCHQTYGNETLASDEYSEWCSNIVEETKDPTKNPFIQYSVKGKQMKIKKYSVRNGCCRYECCCDDDNGKIIDYYCCCTLYSYSLHASNDNRTWTILHKVEKDKNFGFCAVKTFELEKETQPYMYFRLVLDEQWPNCPKCMQVNQIEFYGETVNSGYIQSFDSTDDDESVSIIGKVKRSDE